MNRFLFLLSVFYSLFSCDSSNISPKKSIESDASTPIPPPTLCSSKRGLALAIHSQQTPPLFEGLGDLNYPITTTSDLAQKYFNQGLALAYGFNHAEAARSFIAATRQDSTCAMCHWGLAYVLGPNYNAGMEAEVISVANEALAKAKIISNITPKEKDLIAALSIQNQEVIPAEYKSIMQANDGYIIKKGKKVGFVFLEGNSIRFLLPMEYVNIHKLDNGHLKGLFDNFCKG